VGTTLGYHRGSWQFPLVCRLFLYHRALEECRPLCPLHRLRCELEALTLGSVRLCGRVCATKEDHRSWRCYDCRYRQIGSRILVRLASCGAAGQR